MPRSFLKSIMQDNTLRCSFCHKSYGVAGKLISSPSDYPRAHICDECIAVCNSVIEDENPSLEDSLTTQFFEAAEKWFLREAEGQDAYEELSQMRNVARRLFGETRMVDGPGQQPTSVRQ